MAAYTEYLVMLNSDPSDAAAIAELQKLGSAIFHTAEAASDLDAARNALLGKGAAETADRLFDVELAHAQEARRVELWLGKGRLLCDDLLNESSGLECIGEVLKLEPEHEAAKEMLEHRELVRANWERIVERYLEEAEATSEKSLATTMYRAAAETFARYLPGADEVEQYLRRALQVDPKNQRAAQQLGRLLRQEERWEELREHLGACAANAETAELRNAAWIGLAVLAQGPLPDEDRAVEAMKNVISEDPAHARAVALLAKYYMDSENWASAVTLYANALKTRRRSDSPETEIEMLIQIGMLHWKQLGDVDAAEEYFARLRKLAPAHTVQLDFYRDYYVEKDQSGQLMQLYRQALKSVGASDPERRRQLTVDLAKLSESSMDNPEKAIASWKSILRNEPDNTEARESLRRLYERTGKWNALLDLIKEEVERLPSEDTEGRIAGLLEVVEIYRDQLKLDVMVINTYNSILTVDPSNHDVLEALAQKYRDLGRWNDLIAVLGRKAQVDGVETEERCAILGQIASLWIDRFGNYAQAIKPLEELLELDPTSADAIERLKEIYTRRRQWRALIGLLGREAETLPEAERRVHLADMARLAGEKLGDSRLSIDIWNRVLELPGSTSDPDDIAADMPNVYDALCTLYEREKRFPAVAEILHRRRALAVTAQAALPILERLGTLYSARMRAPAQAAAVYQEILELKPDHGKASRVLRELYAAAGDYDALESLYGGLGQWDELVEAFFSIADRFQDRTDAIHLLERAARVANEHIESPDKVARVYERLQSVDPRHLGAARALVPLYQRASKWAKLKTTYETLLEHADDDDRLPLIDDIRRLCENQLGSKSMAFQWTRTAYEIKPDDTELLADLQRLGAEADAWEDVSSILLARIEQDEVPEEEQLRLLRELGRIADQRLHKPAQAQEFQQRVLTLRPDDAEALDALEQLATRGNDWPALLEILACRVDLADENADKIELLFKISHIQEERLDDLDGATRSYQKVLEIEPDNRRALRALSRSFEQNGNLSGLADVLTQELSVTSDSDTCAALHLRLGGLYLNDLARPDDALAHYKDALTISSSKHVHEALEYFLAEDRPEAVRVEVANLLLPAFERAADFSRIAFASEILLQSSEDPRLDLERRLAGLYEVELNEPEKAYSASARLLLLDPADSSNRLRLDTLGKQLNRSQDVPALLRGALEVCENEGNDASLVRDIALELAVLCDEVLGDKDAAETAWRRVLTVDESSEDAFSALARIYEQGEQWVELRALLSERVERVYDVDQRVAALYQLAEICENQLSDVDAAQSALTQVIEADTEQPRAFDALDRLYVAAENWADLELLLRRRTELLEGESLEATDNRRARLRADRLGDPMGAADLAEDLLGRRAGNTDIRELCEELLKSDDVRLRVARLLEPIYESDGLFDDLCNVLLVQSECADVPAQCFDYLARIAVIQEEQLDRPRAAKETWLHALGKDPSDERSLEALLRLTSDHDGWHELQTALDLAMATSDASDLRTRVRLLKAGAEIAQGELDDSAGSIKRYEELLELDTSDPEVIAAATGALDLLYVQTEQYAKQAAVLQRAAQWAESSEQRKALLARVGEIEETFLDDSAAAITTWDAVLGEDPEDVQALDALERLYTASERHHELSEVLRRRIDMTADGEVRAEMLKRLAELYAGPLDEPSDAIRCLLEALDLDVDHGGVLERLCELYRSTERYDELLEVLERRTQNAEGESRAALLYESGAILTQELSRPSDGLEHFASVLELSPSHECARDAIRACTTETHLRDRASEILIPLYEAEGQHRELVAVLETLCENNDDGRTVMAHRRRIADIHENDLSDSEAALASLNVCLRAALSEPELPEVLAELQRLSASLGKLEELVAVYREIAPDVFDGDLQRRLYLDIADLCRAVLGDADTAREYYGLVLDSQPDDKRALAALEGLCRDAEDYQGLYDIIVQKAELAGDEIDKRAQCLSEAGTLCAEELARPEDAAMHWEQVLELTPDAREIAEKLQALYLKSERWHDLTEALESRLGFAMTVQEAVVLRVRLGEIYENKINDLDAAVENYGAALSGDPSQATATAALERLLDDPGARGAAADVLEPIYVSQQNWPQLVRIYEIKLEASDEQDERLRLTKYIARLFEDQLEDLDAAFHWLGRVFRESPADQSVRTQLERLATVLEAWGPLAKIYQGYLDDEMSDAPEVRSVAETLAELYDKRLEEVDRALIAYKRVLQAVPDDEDVFARVEGMLIRAQRWHELVGLYEEVVHTAATDERRQDLYARLSGVQEQKLGDNGKAIDALRALLEVNPDNERALIELDRLLHAQRNWYDLADLLQSQIDRSPTEEQQATFRIRLAELREKQLEDVEGAIEQYEIALAMPVESAALLSLERLVIDERYQERIAEILEPVYRANDWWQKLVVILDARLIYTEDSVQRGEMLREIAQLHENRGGDLSLALDALARAWFEDLNDDDLYDRLIALGVQLGANKTLIDALESGIKEQFDQELLGKVLLQLAYLHEQAMSDTVAATSCLRRLLDVSDDHPIALAETDRLLASASAWDDLVPIVSRRAELAEDNNDRLELLRRIAVIHEEQRQDQSTAIEAYREVLNADASDLRALDSLERLYLAAASWNELAQVLLNKLDLSTDAETSRALRFQLIEVYEERLSDNYEAIAQARGILDMAADDGRALDDLRRLYYTESMWSDLLEVLERQLALASGEEEVGLAYEVAALCERELMEVETALERYAAVFDLDASHARTRKALERHMLEDSTTERASEILEPVYRMANDSEALAKLYERRLQVSEDGDPGMRVGLFITLADIYENSLNDLKSAFATWARALRESPDDEGLQEHLERLAAVRGSWQELIDLYEETVADTTDSVLEYSFATKLGRLYEESLGDLDKAAEKHQQALSVASDEQSPLAELARIYERHEKPDDLADVLARQADCTMDDAEQAAFLFKLGDVREHKLNNVADAITTYRDVLERDASHPAARGALERLLLTQEDERITIIGILEPLYEQDGDAGVLANLCLTKLSVIEDSFERAQLYARIAEIAEKDLADPTRAMDAAGGWLAEDPESEEALGELTRLGEMLGRFDEVVARLDGIVDTTDSEDLRVRLGLCSASMKLERLQNLDAALAGFTVLRELQGDNVAVLNGLEQIHRSRGDGAALAEVLWHCAEISYEPAAKRGHFAEVAHLRLQLGLVDESVVAWKEVLELDEGDREAHHELAARYREAQKWDELIEILSIASRHTDDAERDCRLRTEIAMVYSETLEDLDRGVDSWLSVLDLDPTNAQALGSLESLHRRREDFLAVQEILMRRVDAADSDEERTSIYMRLSQVAEIDRDAPEEATDYLQNVLDIDSHHEEAYKQLERILRGLERWHDIVDIHQRRAEFAAEQGDAAAELHWLAQAADTWEGPLENPDAAGEILEKILARDPNSVSALTRLAKIYEGGSDWERCGAILEQALALGPQGRDAADLYVRLGEVALNKDGDAEKAQEHFMMALQYDAHQPLALERLEESARDRDDWPQVADMVRRRYEVCEDPKEKLEMAVELADLYGRRLGQPDQVIPLLEGAAQAAPEDARVIGPLADLYFHAGRFDEAVPMFETLAEAAKKKRRMKEVASYKERLGGIFKAKGDTKAATRYYDEAFRGDPTNVRTMAGLGELHMAAQDWDKARRVYRSMVLQNIDPKLGISKADVYFQLGQIHAALSELPKAKDMYQRAITADKGHEAAKAALAAL